MMDTPERNLMGTPTPISKIQESPFSSFINSLSPINPPKSIHVSQTLGSLSFASPPSVFASPHVNLLKDTFLRRHQVSELEKSPFASDGRSKDSIASVANADQQSVTLVQGEGSAKPLEDSSECATELHRVLTYDSEGPHCKSKTENCSDKDSQSEGDTSMALVSVVQDHSSPKGASGAELNPQDMNHNTEESGCDWQSLIACSSDLVIFNSPDVTTTSKQSLRKSQEEEANVLPSFLSLMPPGEANDMQNSLHIGSNNDNEAQETIEQSTQPMDDVELQQIHQPSENQDISSDTGDQPGKKAFGNLHRGLLRRCLTFEMPRTKMNIEGVIFSSSFPSLQTEEKQLSCNGQPVTPGGDSSKCILPGIGLHLNALASTPKDSGITIQGMLSSISQDPLTNSSLSSLRKDEGPAGNILQIAEDFSQTSVYASNEELHPHSPKKKRKKPETVEEGGSCKRCNCKKSKCLKLYCECFAAGIYCVEPCSCQECFNKPIHEDIVLATRKQIESRNPLAFAPKVIRTTDSAQELGEDSNRTPASARHKQGCNCKKSNCLKKYCECYQGGVGCSISCRCEGCKNAFGRKDGSILRATGPDMEKSQASEKTTKDKTDVSVFQDSAEQNSEFAIPQTPSRLYSRSSVPLATSSKGKPPRSSLGTINPSSALLSTDGTGRSTFLRSQSMSEKHYQKASVNDIPLVLQNTSPPSSGLKTLSPNSKRISSPNSGKTQAIGLKSSRKLILRSIPSFPSLSPRR